MTEIARPGTPFPHDERSMNSYMPAVPGPSNSRHHATSAPRYSPRSLHYPLAEMPAPTPPSLLKRRTSNGSQCSDSSSAGRRNSSTSTLGAASPAAFALHMSGNLSQRRQSTRSNSSFSSSSSSSSNSEPRTPVLRARPGYDLETEIVEADDEYDPESECELGDPALTYRPSLPKHSLSALSARYMHTITRSAAPRLPTIESPQRPKLVRRGTPRPTPTVAALGITPAHGAGEDKRYISLIDGGAWLVRGH